MAKTTPQAVPLADLIKNTDTPSGTAAIWWLGQMGVCIKMGDTILIIDYYASTDRPRIAPPPVPQENVCGVTAFLGTHDHVDHIDWPSWKIWAGTCPDAAFIMPAAHIGPASAKASGIAPDRLIGMNDGDVITLPNINVITPPSKDTASVIQTGNTVVRNPDQTGILQKNTVSIHAIPAAHEFLNQDPETGYYPCLQYIIEGNGVRIYHAGDTLRYEGMLPRLRQFGHFDAAILPINGRDARRYQRGTIGNMTFQEAVDLAGELQPGMVIPGHWDLFARNSADPAEFADYLDAKYGEEIRCLIPTYGQQIIVRQLPAR